MLEQFVQRITKCFFLFLNSKIISFLPGCYVCDRLFREWSRFDDELII